jgi:hypothetical protein
MGALSEHKKRCFPFPESGKPFEAYLDEEDVSYYIHGEIFNVPFVMKQGFHLLKCYGKCKLRKMNGILMNGIAAVRGKSDYRMRGHCVIEFRDTFGVRQDIPKEYTVDKWTELVSPRIPIFMRLCNAALFEVADKDEEEGKSRYDISDFEFTMVEELVPISVLDTDYIGRKLYKLLTEEKKDEIKQCTESNKNFLFNLDTFPGYENLCILVKYDKNPSFPRRGIRVIPACCNKCNAPVLIGCHPQHRHFESNKLCLQCALNFGDDGDEDDDDNDDVDDDVIFFLSMPHIRDDNDDDFIAFRCFVIPLNGKPFEAKLDEADIVGLLGCSSVDDVHSLPVMRQGFHLYTSDHGHTAMNSALTKACKGPEIRGVGIIGYSCNDKDQDIPATSACDQWTELLAVLPPTVDESEAEK